MLIALVVVGTSLWMATEASSFGYRKEDVTGLGAMSPAGWALAGLLLWVIAFPLYLGTRGQLKAAGERRRALEASP